jgi:hypothetical protein
MHKFGAQAVVVQKKAQERRKYSFSPKPALLCTLKGMKWTCLQIHLVLIAPLA